METYSLVFNSLTKSDMAFLIQLANRIGLNYNISESLLKDSEIEMDETEFLMKSKTNSVKLLKGVKDVEKKKNLIKIDIEKL